MAVRVSRRTLLKGAGVAAFLGGSAAVLPQFSLQGAKQTPQTCPSTDLSATEHELIISNWPAYIDPRDNPSSTYAVFQKQTGISVSYSDDVNDNLEFFGKIVNQMRACQPVDRDMFMLTDWMAARMINLGWLQKLDHAKLPNVQANLLPALRHPPWDPNRDYSVPWQSGLTGIAYNANVTGEVRSFEELLTRSDLKGRVTVLTEMRDTMLFMLLVTGADPLDFTDDEWNVAIDRLSQAVSNGQIRAFTGNDYLRGLKSGDIAACEAWSGDVIQAQFDDPNIKFVAPEEGLAAWSDNMLVPNLADHKANAEEWMNYYYDPMVAAKLAAWVNYICPVEGAQQAMEKVDPSLVDNPLIFPTPEILSKAKTMMPLTESQAQTYENDWTNLLTGG
ncbi:MAG TPA: spermidine/putrescine ABC transporter substrate-binding protein [Nocardioidaceae bacterium]|nr:spermidine/putrescine ABC transporter substrate-binding protein [Nocardioidaceae bacterium]